MFYIENEAKENFDQILLSKTYPKFLAKAAELPVFKEIFYDYFKSDTEFTKKIGQKFYAEALCKLMRAFLDYFNLDQVQTVQEARRKQKERRKRKEQQKKNDEDLKKIEADELNRRFVGQELGRAQLREAERLAALGIRTMEREGRGEAIDRWTVSSGFPELGKDSFLENEADRFQSENNQREKNNFFQTGQDEINKALNFGEGDFFKRGARPEEENEDYLQGRRIRQRKRLTNKQREEEDDEINYLIHEFKNRKDKVPIGLWKESENEDEDQSTMRELQRKTERVEKDQSGRDSYYKEFENDENSKRSFIKENNEYNKKDRDSYKDYRNYYSNSPEEEQMGNITSQSPERRGRYFLDDTERDSSSRDQKATDRVFTNQRLTDVELSEPNDVVRQIYRGGSYPDELNLIAEDENESGEQSSAEKVMNSLRKKNTKSKSVKRKSKVKSNTAKRKKLVKEIEENPNQLLKREFNLKINKKKERMF